MVGKSKGKHKTVHAAEVSVAKTAAENGKALEITKRLRKGHSLEPLLNEARELARDHTSAISQLCLAKVELAQAVEGLLKTSLTEQEARPTLHWEQKDQLQNAMLAARTGAVQHSSILCGRFYYRLSEIADPSFESLTWPHVDILADPQTELLEQDPNVCDFETWKEWKHVSSQDLKLKMRLEMETGRMKSAQRQTHNAADIADAIMRSGLLYDSSKQHLGRALAKRQTRLQNQEKSMAQRQAQFLQLQQLTAGNDGFDLNHHLERLKPTDNDENVRNVKQDELEKRNKHKKESEAAMCREWFEEVVEYVKQEVTRHADNDERLTSLIQITSVQLDEILSALAAEQTIDRAQISKVSKGLACLRPEEGICINTQVFFDERTGVPEPFHKAVPTLKEDVIRDALKEARLHEATRDIFMQARMEFLPFANELWDGVWNRWPGQVPSNMSPLDSMSELKACLDASPGEYEPRPLDESSAGLHSLVTSFLMFRLSKQFEDLDPDQVSRAVSDRLQYLVGRIAENKNILQDIQRRCWQEVPGHLCHFNFPMDHVPELSAYLELVFDVDVTVTEVQHLHGSSDARQHLKRQGQQVVGLAEMIPQVQGDSGKLRELGLLLNSETPLFRLESRLDGRLLSASDFAGNDLPDEANGRSVDSDDMSDGGSTVDLENGNGHSEQGSAAAWWNVAPTRFSNAEMRGAILEEIRLAAQVLSMDNHFSSGAAAATGCYIRSFLTGVEDFAGPVLLDHARLLDVEPLKGLLEFLWMLLGLKRHCSTPVMHATELMGCLGKLSMCEVLPDGVVRCSRTALNSIKCHAEDRQRAQADADPQSPTQSMLLSADAQAEQQLQCNGNMSPQQQLEVQEQYRKADMQSMRRHMFCCTDLAKPEVTEEFVKLFVHSVLFYEPQESTDQDEDLLQQNELNTTRLQSAVSQAIQTAKSLAEACSDLVYQLDQHFPEAAFPHRDFLNEYRKEELVSQLISMVDPTEQESALETILESVTMSETRRVATMLPSLVAEVNCKLRKEHEDRAKMVIHGFKRLHLTTLQAMNCQAVTSLDDLCKGEQLHNPHITRMQEAAEDLHIQSVQDFQDATKKRAALNEDKDKADGATKTPTALERYRYYRESLGEDATQLMQTDGELQLKGFLATAADGIVKLSMHLDMLFMQISIYQGCALEARCENMEPYLQFCHYQVLREKLIRVAKENKVRTELQAAERNAQELLATEAKSKSHHEGGQKKGKKKKKGAKQREEKQEEPSPQEPQPTPEQHEPEPNEEAEWEEAAASVVATLPPGLQNAGSGSRSPVGGQADKDEDYWRCLQGGVSQQDEDWSTVDKKKGGRGKMGSKQPDPVPITAVAPTPSSYEEDGWEDHSELLEPPRPTPPGLHPRPDAKPSSNDENRQPGQEPATPSGRGNSEVQCGKCGRWGHPEENCSEQYCDLCAMHGHSTLGCPKKSSLRPGGRGAGEHGSGRQGHPGEPQRMQKESSSNAQLCHNCKEPGHLHAQCPHIMCFKCHQFGHYHYNCVNPEVPRSAGSKTVPLTNSRKFGGDGQGNARQQGTEEQGRGRQRSGRGRDQQADAASSTLSMTRSGRRGQGGRHAQQDPGADYSSVSAPAHGNSSHVPDAGPPSTASFGPPPPPPPRDTRSHRGSSHSVPISRSAGLDGQQDRADTSGWDQPEEQAAGSAWSGQDDKDDDESSFHSMPVSPVRQSPHSPVRARHSRSVVQGPAFGPAWTSSGNRPTSARSHGVSDPSDRISQGSGASVSGQGHSALPQGLLQPGMDAVEASAWSGAAFAAQSSDPQFAHQRMPDQLTSSSDPVVSPGFMHRSAPARAYQPQHPQQQQPGFNPAAPLQSFVTQESQEYGPRLQVATPAAVMLAASAAVVSDDDMFLNDVLAQQQEDNKPVGIYSVPAAAAVWPELSAAPVVPGHQSWAARLDTNKADPAAAAGQDDEADEELQKALQASLAETQSEQKQAAYAAELMRQDASHEPATASTMGLRNATGEYNCFLNVIIQCMWHCRVFRQSVMDWHPAAYQDNDVVRALIGLFKAFADRERSRAPSQAVDPTQLREALGNLEGDKFRVGQMGDAAEVLTALYEKLAVVAAKAGEPSMLDDNFGLHVRVGNCNTKLICFTTCMLVCKDVIL
ncbi:hypothetical protein ABBQ32_003915 [Trebouxia sp. C0010 RCD-2024]